MTFGRAEQARYQDHIVPIFGDFLKKCYSMSFLSFWRVFLTRLPGKEDCLEFALREDNAEVVGVENVDFPSASDGISSRDKPLAGNVFPPNLEGIGADAVGIFPTPLSPRAFSPAPLPTPNPPIAALYPPDELPQTDDLTESDKDLTSTSTLADPNAAQASSTQQRLQPKRGLGEIVPADEAANGRRSIPKVPPPNLEDIGADAVGIFRGSPTPFSPRAFSPAPLPIPDSPIAAVYPPNELPRTDDLTELDKDLTSTSTLADPNAQQRLQPKRGLGEIVPADEAANGRRSKRRRVLNMDPIKEALL